MKRILIITPSLKSGGTENHIKKIISELQYDYEFIILCLNELDKKTNISNKLSNFKCKIYYYSVGFRNIKKTYLAIKKLSKYEMDVVHSFVYQKHLFEITLLFFLKYKKLITERRNIQHWRKSKKLNYLEKLRNNLTDYVVCNSEAVSECVVEIEKIKSSKIRLIFNGAILTDEVKYSEKIKISFEHWNTFNIITVANIKKNKNIISILKAIQLLPKELANRVNLNIVGSPQDLDYLNEITAYSKSFDLNVKFYGELNDLEHIYMSAHLFILLSYAEGSPNSAIEAATYGIPLLLSNVGGNINLEKVIGGVLVEPEDHHGCANAIGNILSNRQIWESYSRNTYLKSKFFSLKKMVNGYVELYKL